MRHSVTNFIGKKVNRVTILESVGVVNGKTRVRVLCDCGKEFICRFDSLMNGSTKACGCFNSESSTTHGLSKHPLFKIWLGMKQRCYDKNINRYKDYGGSGVIVCDEWVNDFKAFYDWAIKNGWQEGLQIDKDILSKEVPGKLYSPDTCCFVTAKINSRNKRNNVILFYNGESMCMSEWCEKLNLDYKLIANRISNGWPHDIALTKPMDKRYSKHFRK